MCERCILWGAEIQFLLHFFGENGQRCFRRAPNGSKERGIAKLHKMNDDGIRDTTYYKTALFQDICSSSSVHSHPNISEREVDHPFCNKPACLELEEFQKLKVEAQDDMSSSTLVRLDALITSVVDGFGTFVEKCESQRSFISCESAAHNGTLCDSRVEDAANCETHAVVEKSTLKSKKGERIPVESRKRYRQLLPIAVENVLCESLLCLKNALDDDADKWDADREEDPGANGECVPDNSCRKHTIAFKYSGTGHVYIALKARSIRKLVCEWIGHVLDCYILHSRGFGKAVSAFRSSDPLDVFNNSN